ncbi:PspC domain-containing protein [Aeromonas jandaei]|uniref:PspC domain-containing protein n=1 Tax=Aeromonas jandaei TaxID=650 RepID=UPI003F791C12
MTGVCAGIAKRLGISRVTVRVVALLALILVPPLALAAYLLAVLVMPPRYELKRWLD